MASILLGALAQVAQMVLGDNSSHAFFKDLIKELLFDQRTFIWVIFVAHFGGFGL